MVRHARATGIDFGWVGADAGYGKGLTFMKELHTTGETFMVDVHSDFYVFLKPVKPYLPVKEEMTIGRTPTRYRVDQKPVRIDEWAKRQSQSAWKKIAVRESTKGMLEYEYLTIDCWIWEKDTKNVYRWRLIVRRIPETKSDYKYSLSNSDKMVPLQQLRICLLCDSLYAAATVTEICKHYGWTYIICYKEGSIPSVYQEFQTLLTMQMENRCTNETKDVFQKISWATDIDYQKHALHLIRSLDEDKLSKELKTFLYLTNIKPTKSTVRALANGAGRQRWKIENQGFNMQKNGGYNLEHVYSENENASKCFYLCLQIAHTINQLLEKSSLIAGAIKKFGSLKNFTRHLLDAIRFISIENSDIAELFLQPFQIRLNGYSP